MFADSSALVKLYADESASGAVRGLDPLVISCLARVEVPAAIWRKRRLGELSDPDARLLTAEFEADYYGADNSGPRFVVVALTAETLDMAAVLTSTDGLRAYDAVQLASALAVREADPTCATIACFDRVLCAAASARGFRLLT